MDDLKLITFENEEPDPNYILEEVDLAAENQVVLWMCQFLV